MIFCQLTNTLLYLGISQAETIEGVDRGGQEERGAAEARPGKPLEDRRAASS